MKAARGASLRGKRKEKGQQGEGERRARLDGHLLRDLQDKERCLLDDEGSLGDKLGRHSAETLVGDGLDPDKAAREGKG